MAYQIGEEEYREIKAREKETRDTRISKRLKVLMLRYRDPGAAAVIDCSTFLPSFDELGGRIVYYKNER